MLLRSELFFADIRPETQSNFIFLLIFNNYYIYYVTAALNIYEKWHSTSLRARAIEKALDHIRAEDENTKCVGIGPVS